MGNCLCAYFMYIYNFKISTVRLISFSCYSFNIYHRFLCVACLYVVFCIVYLLGVCSCSHKLIFTCCQFVVLI